MVELTCDVSLGALYRLEPGVSLGHLADDMGAGPLVRPQPSDGDDVRRAVRCPVTAPVGLWRIVSPDDAGRGATPHGMANDDSPPSLPGSSPAC